MNKLLFILTLLFSPLMARAAYYVHAKEITTTQQANEEIRRIHLSPGQYPEQLFFHSKPKEGWEGEASLMPGIMGLLLVVPAIPAIILGYIAIKKGKKAGVGVAGAILGFSILGAVLAVLVFYWIIIMLFSGVSVM